MYLHEEKRFLNSLDQTNEKLTDYNVTRGSDK
jgi:hypothetical protein